MKGDPRLGTHKPQISPLRCAPVAMTKLGVTTNQAFLNPMNIPVKVKTFFLGHPSFCGASRIYQRPSINLKIRLFWASAISGTYGLCFSKALVRCTSV